MSALNELLLGRCAARAGGARPAFYALEPDSAMLGAAIPIGQLDLQPVVMSTPALFAAVGQAGTAPASPPRVRINPTNRTLRFVVPVTDGPTYLGDVELAVAPDDSLSIVAPRLFRMLEPLLKPDILERLRASIAQAGEISAAQLAAEKIAISYDAQKLALAVAIPVPVRRPNNLSLASSFAGGGETLQPARVSAYLNLRSAFDLVERGPDKGLAPPVSLLDGAIRALGIVAESEGYLSFRRNDPLLRRTGSRLVHDDLGKMVRWTAGDLRAFARSFQAAPAVAGVSASRIYGILDPSRDIRSTGSQSFTLLAPSTVETLVNGRSVERKLLQPGTYTLQDFPLAEGSNDVRLLIEDETGRRRTVEFNLYSNRQLLEPGKTEFAAFAGVYSGPTRSGIAYSREWATSAFVRRGLSQQFAGGLNGQADARAQQVGGELLLGTSFGLIGVDFAGSRRRGGENGYALAASFEKLIAGASLRSQSVRAMVEYRSEGFAIPGALTPREPLKLRASAGWSMTLGRDSFVALDGQYAHDRTPHAAHYNVRGSGGFRLTETLGVIGEIEWERSREREGGLVRLGLRQRFGFRGSAQIDVDSRGFVRANYEQSRGRGIGAWTGSVDLNRTPDGTAINANGTYTGNRLELGSTQIASYDANGGAVRDVRTSMRAATSIAFADGALALGRPIQDGFLIARPHRSLHEKEVRLDPFEGSVNARSGALGGAVAGNLSAYSPRLLTYEVPDAPAGYDLGQGNVQLRPPYRAGYKLDIGSDYNLLVIGRLVDRNGEPVSLLAGKAIDLGAPKRPAVTMFTARNGRFGAQGLRPGRWRIEMPTEPPIIYEVEVKDDPSGTVRLGDIRPLEQ